MPIRTSGPTNKDGISIRKFRHDHKSEDYSTEYIETCFHAWYKAGKPTGSALIAVIPIIDLGGKETKPSRDTIYDWRRTLGWEERADGMDADLSKELEKITIEEKVEMFRRHAKTAKTLIGKGLDYLEQFGVDSSPAAIRAIVEGARLERESVGIPQALMRISEMTDQQLSVVVGDLMNVANNAKDKPEDDDVIEGNFSGEDDADQSEV